MDIKIHKVGVIRVAKLISNNIEIGDAQDALNLIVSCNELGAKKIIIKEANIIPDFFNLSTGIAGEILQKFSNYFMELAIIGDFTKYKSKSLKDFIYESNRHGKIMFLPSVEIALEKLTKNK